jgi:hypothetical protein
VNLVTEQERATACHQMLLRLAGRTPDGLLTQSRDWLARGQFGELARSVAFWAVSQDIVLTEADAELLSGLLGEAGADPSVLSALTLEDLDPFPYYAFAPQIPPDLVGEAGGTPAEQDPAADEAVARAVAAEPGVIGAWRAWRFPADGAPWPRPRRVFVVEVAAAVDEPGAAARLQGLLAAAGEADPQVEVYQSGSALPVYQEFARSYGELLWAAAPDPGVHLAEIFDEIDVDAGPLFRPDHLLLDDGEADKVVQYLYGGEPLLVTSGLMDDVMDSTQVYCVPMSFRTDGAWVWNEAAAYYAEQYQLAPDSGLLDHLRSNDYAAPAVDGVGVHRALQILQDAAGEELVWMFNSELDESAEPEETLEDVELAADDDDQPVL